MMAQITKELFETHPDSISDEIYSAAIDAVGNDIQQILDYDIIPTNSDISIKIQIALEFIKNHEDLILT
jgi:hypothetical protein